MKSAMTALLNEAASLLRSSRKTVALTGAGVSTESGIPDFRGRNGLWSRYDPIEYGTIDAFRRDPEKVWKMLAELLHFAEAQPNEGHLALARLEEKKLLAGIITQNIDGLHPKAGSCRVVEFHGSLATFSCPSCATQYGFEEVRKMRLAPSCRHCSSLLKPDVVFFDEQIPPAAFRQTEELLQGAEVLLVAGTSCHVVPASYIPERVWRQGGRIIEINLEPALGDMAHVVLANGFSKAMIGLLAALE